MKDNIKNLLDSGISNYAISKETGIAQTTLGRFTTGKSEIGNMSLDNAIKLNDYYNKIKLEERVKMEKINKIIKEVENFERQLDASVDPSFEEKEFTDGATEYFISFPVEDTDVELLFAEMGHIKEMRDAVYAEEKTEDDLIELIEETNGLDDQYDFDNVVAYRYDDGEIEWI